MDVLVEDEPEPVPMTPPPRARVLPLAKTGFRGPARAVEPVSRLWTPKLKPTCPQAS